MDPKIDRVIRAAIDQRKLLRLHYKGSERIVEPHDYGVHKGAVKLLASISEQDTAALHFRIGAGLMPTKSRR